MPKSDRRAIMLKFVGIMCQGLLNIKYALPCMQDVKSFDNYGLVGQPGGDSAFGEG